MPDDPNTGRTEGTPPPWQPPEDSYTDEAEPIPKWNVRERVTPSIGAQHSPFSLLQARMAALGAASLIHQKGGAHTIPTQDDRVLSTASAFFSWLVGSDDA